MNSHPGTKEASAPARTPANKTRNDRQGHSVSNPVAQSVIHGQGAHAPLEAAANRHASRIIRSAMDFGWVGPLDVPAEIMPTPELERIARLSREAFNQGREGFAELQGFIFEQPLSEADRASLRIKVCEIADQPLAERPGALEAAVQAIREFHRTKQIQLITWKLQSAMEAGEDPNPIIRELSEAAEGTTAQGIEALLAVRAFNFGEPPEKPTPILTLCGKPLCTPGNITNIQAPPKAGKSAALEAVIAAVFTDGRQCPDTLGFDAWNPEGKALIHFDTEQSPYDHDVMVRRAIRRANVIEAPTWFRSYSMADLDIRQRRVAILHEMNAASKAHGGVLAILIDGIGDICENLNDPGIAFDLVAELHTLAITFDCAVVTVLHENPGSESGKTRGHLGSQLERKAETNLRLAKDKDGITTIWAERARHCYLPREQGPCFSWNDAKGMHTSCGTAGEIKSAATRDRMEGEADSAFGGEETMSYTDLVKAIMDSLDIKERAAKDRVKKWRADGVIRKNTDGTLTLANP